MINDSVIRPRYDFIRSWGGRLGMATDRWLNVFLFNGSDTMTVSMHAALAEQAGKRWGCWTCWCLSLIQNGHCRLTLNPNVKEAAGAAIRFGLVMITGFVLFGIAVHLLIKAI